MSRLAPIALGIGGAVAIAVMVVVGVTAYVNRPRAGSVIASWLVPAHSETYQSGSICAGYDSHSNCTVHMPIFSQRWVPDRCYIRIRTDEAKPREADWSTDCAAIPAIGSWVHGS